MSEQALQRANINLRVQVIILLCCLLRQTQHSAATSLQTESPGTTVYKYLRCNLMAELSHSLWHNLHSISQRSRTFLSSPSNCHSLSALPHIQQIFKEMLIQTHEFPPETREAHSHFPWKRHFLIRFYFDMSLCPAMFPHPAALCSSALQWQNSPEVRV